MTGPDPFLALQGQALGGTASGLTLVVAKALGVAVLAGFVAGLVALAYRWYVRERVPVGLALLTGLAAVAVSLSTTTLLAAELAPDRAGIELVTALANVVTFLTGALAAYAGTTAGDRLGVNLFAATGAGSVDADVSEIVRHVGRVVAVQLPEEIDDVVGYDPVPEATRETLAGRRFLFPRRLSRAELRDRLVSRLKTDYGVGHVDVEIADDGTVEYLAVGSRAAGIGPTLPPATNAVAVRADPAHAASAGDVVQVWETDPFRRVLTGELRGVAGDVVTVAIDAADTPKLDPTERYRLVTLPVEDRPDREFASLLRAADETMVAVTVEAGSSLEGTSVDDLDVTVAAVTREDAEPAPLPAPDRALAAGDVVYAIATPEALRRLEATAAGEGERDDGSVTTPAATAGDVDRGGVDRSDVDATDVDRGDGETASHQRSAEGDDGQAADDGSTVGDRSAAEDGDGSTAEASDGNGDGGGSGDETAVDLVDAMVDPDGTDPLADLLESSDSPDGDGPESGTEAGNEPDADDGPETNATDDGDGR